MSKSALEMLACAEERERVEKEKARDTLAVCGECLHWRIYPDSPKDNPMAWGACSIRQGKESMRRACYYACNRLKTKTDDK